MRLYNGNTIWVAAISFAAADELVVARDLWMGIWEDLKVIPLNAEPDDAAIKQLVAHVLGTVLGWRQMLVLILADSNPGMDIDLEWCRCNLKAVDIVRIARVAVDENGFGPLVGAAKKAIGGYAAAKWRGSPVGVDDGA